MLQAPGHRARAVAGLAAHLRRQAAAYPPADPGERLAALEALRERLNREADRYMATFCDECQWHVINQVLSPGVFDRLADQEEEDPDGEGPDETP